tara:strand:+ start:15105 stop:23966 length:8862 start_codon:yes stop_codon:yes gene_type:complete
MSIIYDPEYQVFRDGATDEIIPQEDLSNISDYQLERAVYNANYGSPFEEVKTSPQETPGDVIGEKFYSEFQYEQALQKAMRQDADGADAIVENLGYLDLTWGGMKQQWYQMGGLQQGVGAMLMSATTYNPQIGSWFWATQDTYDSLFPVDPTFMSDDVQKAFINIRGTDFSKVRDRTSVNPLVPMPPEYSLVQSGSPHAGEHYYPQTTDYMGARKNPLKFQLKPGDPGYGKIAQENAWAKLMQAGSHDDRIKRSDAEFYSNKARYDWYRMAYEAYRGYDEGSGGGAFFSNMGRGDANREAFDRAYMPAYEYALALEKQENPDFKEYTLEDWRAGGQSEGDHQRWRRQVANLIYKHVIATDPKRVDALEADFKWNQYSMGNIPEDVDEDPILSIGGGVHTNILGEGQEEGEDWDPTKHYTAQGPLGIGAVTQSAQKDWGKRSSGIMIYKNPTKKQRELEMARWREDVTSGTIWQMGNAMFTEAREFYDAAIENDKTVQTLMDWSQKKQYTWGDLADSRLAFYEFGKALPSQGTSLLAYGVGTGVGWATKNVKLGMTVSNTLAYLNTFNMEGGGAYAEVTSYFNDPRNKAELTELYGENYKDHMHLVAANIAWDTAIPNAVLEMLPVGHLASKWGLNGTIKKRLFRQSIRNHWFKETMGVVGNVMVGVAVQSIEESATEILQTLNELAQMEQLTGPVSAEEKRKAIMMSGYGGFIGGGGMASMGGIVRTADHFYGQLNRRFRFNKYGEEVYDADFVERKNADGSYVDPDLYNRTTINDGQGPDLKKITIQDRAGNKSDYYVNQNFDDTQLKRMRLFRNPFTNSSTSISQVEDKISRDDAPTDINEDIENNEVPNQNEDNDVRNNIILPDLSGTKFKDDYQFQGFAALLYENVRRILRTGLSTIDGQIVDDILKQFAGTEMAEMVASGKFKTKDVVLAAIAKYGGEILNQLDNVDKHQFPVNGGTYMTIREFYDMILDDAIRQMPSVQGNPKKAAIVKNKILQGGTDIKFNQQKEPVATGGTGSIDVSVPINKEDLQEARDRGIINPDEFDSFNKELEEDIAKEEADNLEAELLAEEMGDAAALDVDAFMNLKIKGAGQVYGNLEKLAATGNQRARELIAIIKDKVANGKRKEVVDALEEGRTLLDKNKPKKKTKSKKKVNTDDSQSHQQSVDEMGDEAVSTADESSFFGEEDNITLSDLGLDDSEVQEVEIDDSGTKVRFINKGKPQKDKKKLIKELSKKIRRAKLDIGKLIKLYKDAPTSENEINLKNALAVYMSLGEDLAELKGVSTKKRFKKEKSKRKVKDKNKADGEVLFPALIEELAKVVPGLKELLQNGETLEIGGRSDFSGKQGEGIANYFKALVMGIGSLRVFSPYRKSGDTTLTVKDTDGGTHSVKVEGGDIRNSLERLKKSGKKVQVILLNEESVDSYSDNLDEWFEIMSLAYDVLEDGGYVIGYNSNVNVSAGTQQTPFLIVSPEELSQAGLEVLQKVPSEQKEEAPAIDNTQPDNTAPDTNTETLSGIMNDIASDIIEAGKAYITPPKTLEELKEMSDSDLQNYLLGLQEGEIEPGDTRDDIIQKIRNIEGSGGEMFSTMGVPPPRNYKRFAAALDKLWVDVKKLGSALLEEFVKMIRKDINAKYKGEAKYELLIMLDKWWQDKNVAENPDALDALGFNIRKRKEQARAWATDGENSTINTATEEDIIMDDIEGLEAFTEEENITDDNEINFEKNHAHTMVGRRFVQALEQTVTNDRMKEIMIMARDYNGVATKEIADRYAWVKEGETLNQKKFVIHFVTHFQEEFPALKTIGTKGKNSIKHMWIVNQVGNKMSFAIEQQFVVLNGKLQPRPEKLHNVADPSTVVPSFIEADEVHGQYILDHVAIMRADNVYKKNKGFFFKDDETKLDGAFLRNAHIEMAGQGWAIVGVKAGTTPSLVFVKVTKEQFDKSKNWEFYWKDQHDQGFITDEDLANYMDFKEMLKANPKLPEAMLAQEIAIHELMQKVRWDKYALEGGGAIANFKRLKLDMSRGTKLTGFRPMQTVQFDYNNVIFSRNGKVVPHMGTGNLEGKYLFDGMLMTSGEFMKDFSEMFGFAVWEAKPVIRVRRPDGNYVCIKCHAQVPLEGLKIYEKNADGTQGKLIASMNLERVGKTDTIVIRDGQGNKIDFIGSQDEFKNASGDFRKLNTANEITGDEIRILSLDKTSKTDAAFPKVWLDLLSGTADKKVRNLLLKHLHKTLQDDFFADGGPASNIFKLFGDHKNEKYIQSLLKQLTKMNDTLPNSVADYIRNLSAGYGHPVFLNELKEVVKNRIFVDYILKGRIRGAGTMSSFSPNLGDDVGPGEVHMGIHNKWIKSLVEQEWRRVTGSTDPLTLDEANKFLQEFDISILGIRQPINGKTGVKMLRVTKLLPSYRGNISVTNQEDTFNIFTGDHDGDHIFFLGFPKELTETLKEHMESDSWKDSHEDANLDIFVQANTDWRISNIEERFAAIDGNVGALGSIENIISTKRARGQLINKEIKDFKIGATTFRLVNPSDEVIMDYAPLDDEKLHLVPENKRVQINGRWFLKTTSEHEIGILANAATDNPDRVLLAGWGYDPTWLISRVFRIIGPDGKEFFLDPETHKLEITVLKWLLKEYKIFSTYEKGRNTKQKNMKMNHLLNVSQIVLEGQTDEAAKVMNFINTKINKIKKKTRGKVIYPRISELKLDESQKGIGQMLIGMIKFHENKFRRENKHLYIGNQGFMDRPEQRVQTANLMASRVVESRRNIYSKMYNLSTQDRKDGYLFLRKFLYGKGAKFDQKLNKWVHQVDEDGNKIGGGFYTIFENLENQHNNEEQHQVQSKMMMGGYTYNHGMDALMEDFFEEFKNLSEGAQAAFIYGFYTQAPVNWTMHRGQQMPASIVKAKNISKFLPAAFATIYKKDGTRDWTITDDWFSHWSINFQKGQSPTKEQLAETQRFIPIDEITKCT